MKNILKLLVILAFVALLSGCGEGLTPKVAALEAELAKEKAALVAAKAELAKEKEAQVAVNAELAKEKAALVAAKAELAKVALAEKLEADRKAQADKNTTLSVQVGITMQSGDTKPVSNQKIYLTRRKASVYLGDIKLKNNFGTIGTLDLGVFSLWKLGIGKGAILYSNLAIECNLLAKKEAIFVVNTDFNGVAIFEEVPKGDYYVLCVTPLGGGSVLEKRVTISTSKTKIALSNDDSID